MQYNKIRIFQTLFIGAFLFSLSSCTLKFSQAALNEDNAVKTEAMKLFSQAGDPYANHSAAADTLRAHIRQALAYEQTRKPGNNKITVQMWTTLTDSSQAIEKNINFWKTNQTMSKPLQQNVDTIVGQIFDRIIQLEQARPH